MHTESNSCELRAKLRLSEYVAQIAAVAKSGLLATLFLLPNIVTWRVVFFLRMKPFGVYLLLFTEIQIPCFSSALSIIGSFM